VGPGGNDQPPYSRQMQNRLFKNDGKGNFTLDDSAFPINKEGVNTGVAIACDFDHDGDLDLFIGGRSDPRNYGMSPASFLFVNDGKGHFTDIAALKNPDIAKIGMVTSATWADVTGDGNKELIIVGEWMAPRIFSYSGDHFTELKSNLNDLYGWWQSVSACDVNGDGKPDLVLGNIGENFYLHPDKDHPVKMWISDFNQNGSTDKILTYTVDGKDLPVFLKHDMQDQVPAIKKKSLRHEEYAKKPIKDLFASDIMEKSIVKDFNYTSSCVAINDGNGNFSLQKLPSMVQLSSVNAASCIDINHDGHVDLVLGGNQFGLLPQFERLDASLGHVLLNDGKGGFSWLWPAQSGIQVRGMIRDIATIKGKNKTWLLFLQNDDYPVLYELNQ
jgi:hypothetical protein